MNADKVLTAETISADSTGTVGGLTAESRLICTGWPVWDGWLAEAAEAAAPSHVFAVAFVVVLVLVVTESGTDFVLGGGL